MDWVWSDEIERPAMEVVRRMPIVAVRRRHDESMDSTISRLVSDVGREVEIIDSRDDQT